MQHIISCPIERSCTVQLGKLWSPQLKSETVQLSLKFSWNMAMKRTGKERIKTLADQDRAALPPHDGDALRLATRGWSIKG
jgi:hypothetical protein